MAVLSVGRGQTLLDTLSYSRPLNISTSTRLHLGKQGTYALGFKGTQGGYSPTGPLPPGTLSWPLGWPGRGLWPSWWGCCRCSVLGCRTAQTRCGRAPRWRCQGSGRPSPSQREGDTLLPGHIAYTAELAGRTKELLWSHKCSMLWSALLRS